MAFFDNLSGIISEKGKEAATVAKKVAEIANLKGRIAGVETEIKKNYRKIGEAYFEAYKDAEVSCEFEELVQAIRDAKATVAEMTSKLNELKGDSECKSCGSAMKAGSSFCSNCGAKVEVEYFDEEDCDCDHECDCVSEEEKYEGFVSEVVEEVAEELEDVVEELEEIVEQCDNK